MEAAGRGLSGAELRLPCAPLVAMRFTREVDWNGDDFIVMGIMLAIVCGAIELAVRLSGNRSYRLGVAAAIGGAFLITWVNLAVGIVGSEHNPSNLLFFYALLLGIAGAVIARLKPRGMALAMIATAAAIALAFIVAVSRATDETNVSHWRELLGTAIISAPFLLSAWLFRKAAGSRAQPEA